eukprot:scaffold12267_cov120-Isochrysis_galbana.AAC.10
MPRLPPVPQAAGGRRGRGAAAGARNTLPGFRRRRRTRPQPCRRCRTRNRRRQNSLLHGPRKRFRRKQFRPPVRAGTAGAVRRCVGLAAWLGLHEGTPRPCPTVSTGWPPRGRWLSRASRSRQCRRGAAESADPPLPHPLPPPLPPPPLPPPPLPPLRPPPPPPRRRPRATVDGDWSGYAAWPEPL